MPIEEQVCPVERLTDGPFMHFFGYYDKCPWSQTEGSLLALRVAFMDRPPTAQDMAVVGRFDQGGRGRWQPLAETTAWHWQQGTMLQWLPSAPETKIIFNTRRQDRFESCLLDVESREHVEFARSIYALSPGGRGALSLNFARVHRTRPGYGYPGGTDRWASALAPEGDGIYYLDLESGESRLIVSLAQIVEIEHRADMDGAEHWFNHLQFNPSGERFIFLHRWRGEAGRWQTRMFTARADGSEIALLGQEGMVSHFDWRDDDQILAWSRHEGEDHYHLYYDRTERVEVVGADVLDCDGHCSFSPDRQWVLTDTYPDRERSERTLILYRPETNTRYNIGRFYSPREIGGEIRCDLHPRWSRDGRRVCIDSVHEGERQMYVVDVSAVVG